MIDQDKNLGSRAQGLYTRVQTLGSGVSESRLNVLDMGFRFKGFTAGTPEDKRDRTRQQLSRALNPKCQTPNLFTH